MILSGPSTGTESGVCSTQLLGAAVYSAFALGTGNNVIVMFAIALAGASLLITVGMIVSMDSFGPVTGSALGTGGMSGHEEDGTAQALTHLDATGNTTKPIAMGVLVGTAMITESLSDSIPRSCS